MRYTLSNGILSAEFKPSGAELYSLIDRNGSEYIWQGANHIWARHSPVLFPIVGKLKGNTAKFRGKAINLNQHGFARDMMFECVAQTENSIEFRLSSDKETLEIYPFEFQLFIKYTLNKNEIETEYRVVSGSPELPFSIGAHPGFNIVLNEEESIEDYYLKFSEVEKADLYYLKDGLLFNQPHKEWLLGDALGLTEEMFGKDALIFKGLKSDIVSLKNKAGNYCVTLKAAGAPYWGFWQKYQSNFLCIEPWWGITDAYDTNSHFEQKEGIILLPEGKEFKASYSIIIG